MASKLEEAYELLVEYAMDNDDINSERMAEISDIFGMLEAILCDAAQTEECVLAQKCTGLARTLLGYPENLDKLDLESDFLTRDEFHWMISSTIDGLKRYKSKI